MSLASLNLLSAVHGGTDAGPPVRWDFSTNANPLGPLQPVAAAVASADRQRYPEPHYLALRQQLAAWHEVDAERVVPAGSAGEWIWRITHALRRVGQAARVWVPQPGYGEYATAAHALGCEISHWPGTLADGMPALRAADLLWICEPCNPTGQALAADELSQLICQAQKAGAICVLDLAYQPLRLDGAGLPAAAERAWQLWSPNKACGMTGVRGAYALAPQGQERDAEALRRFAPSWVLGAEGAAMLASFGRADAQALLAEHRAQLAHWKHALGEGLRERGWVLRESMVPFLLARPPGAEDRAAQRHVHWRARGLKLRDAASFGLPGWVRLCAQPPAAQAELFAACDEMERQT